MTGLTVTNDTHENRFETDDLFSTEVIETPEFKGKRLRTDMDLLEHVNALVADLELYPELTYKQRCNYFHQSLGYKLQPQFQPTDSIRNVGNTLLNILPRKQQEPEPELPWYVKIAELRQDGLTLSEYLTDLFTVMNSILSGYLSAYHKDILQLVMVTALVNGLNSRPYEALIFKLKQWSRFQHLIPDSDLFVNCANALLDWESDYLAGVETAKLRCSDRICPRPGCNDQYCVYDHGKEFSWSLQLAYIRQERGEPLLAFLHRVKELMRKLKESHPTEKHECMEIIATISLLNNMDEEYLKVLNPRFKAWITNPLSKANSKSDFTACCDIINQYSSELDKKGIKSKKQLKRDRQKFWASRNNNPSSYSDAQSSYSDAPSSSYTPARDEESVPTFPVLRSANQAIAREEVVQDTGFGQSKGEEECVLTDEMLFSIDTRPDFDLIPRTDDIVVSETNDDVVLSEDELRQDDGKESMPISTELDRPRIATTATTDGDSYSSIDEILDRKKPGQVLGKRSRSDSSESQSPFDNVESVVPTGTLANSSPRYSKSASPVLKRTIVTPSNTPADSSPNIRKRDWSPAVSTSSPQRNLKYTRDSPLNRKSNSPNKYTDEEVKSWKQTICRYGSMCKMKFCRYAHRWDFDVLPECKYGQRCTNQECFFLHNNK